MAQSYPRITWCVHSTQLLSGPSVEEISVAVPHLGGEESSLTPVRCQKVAQPGGKSQLQLTLAKLPRPVSSTTEPLCPLLPPLPFFLSPAIGCGSGQPDLEVGDPAQNRGVETR